jgi:hypothetical protein
MWGEDSVDMASPVSPFILIAVHNQRLDMTRSHLYDLIGDMMKALQILEMSRNIVHCLT